ncbi:hypothetical protein Y032_0173g430 [Ancylostoma ceylanicum]|nr:hypothetical protein Y032_0173g430 [Ancylostoma ceylanicum]
MLNFETTPQDLCFHYINYSKKDGSSNYSIISMSTFRYRVKKNELWNGMRTSCKQESRRLPGTGDNCFICLGNSVELGVKGEPGKLCYSGCVVSFER